MADKAFTCEIHKVFADDKGNIMVEIPSLSEETTAPHRIIIPVEAIGARMALYGLKTPEEAFDAILREHGCRISDDITLPEKATKAEHYGGLHEAVEIVKEKGVATQIKNHLRANRSVIKEAHKARVDDPRYRALRGEKD